MSRFTQQHVAQSESITAGVFRHAIEMVSAELAREAAADTDDIYAVLGDLFLEDRPLLDIVEMRSVALLALGIFGPDCARRLDEYLGRLRARLPLSVGEDVDWSVALLERTNRRCAYMLAFIESVVEARRCPSEAGRHRAIRPILDCAGA